MLLIKNVKFTENLATRMKTKVFLTVMAVVFGSTLLKAQYSDREVSFAVNLQSHVSWMHGDEASISKGPIRLGMGGGLSLDYRLERFYALSFGISLNHTGGNITYRDSLYLELSRGKETLQPGTRVTYRLQYVEIPLAIKFNMPEIGYSTWFAEIGLDPMLNTRAFINATDNNINKEPFPEGLRKINLAWHTGFGLNYLLGRHRSLQFALMYKNTFMDVTREKDIRKADNVRINEVGIRIGLVF